MFGLLAHGALLQELGDIALEAAPVEVFAHALVGGSGAGVTTHRTAVQRGDELGAQSSIGTDPEAPLALDSATVELVAVLVGAVQGELLQPLLCVRIGGVGVDHLLHPRWLARRERDHLELLAHVGERVCGAII